MLGEIVTGLRPDLSYAGVDLRVEHENDLSSLVQDIDVVACCADEPSLDVIASLVARVCVPARVPHIICGYHGATGRVGPFWYPRRRALPCPGCHSLFTAAGLERESVDPRPRGRQRLSAFRSRNSSPRSRRARSSTFERGSGLPRPASYFPSTRSPWVAPARACPCAATAPSVSADGNDT